MVFVSYIFKISRNKAGTNEKIPLTRDYISNIQNFYVNPVIVVNCHRIKSAHEITNFIVTKPNFIGLSK